MKKLERSVLSVTPFIFPHKQHLSIKLKLRKPPYFLTHFHVQTRFKETKNFSKNELASNNCTLPPDTHRHRRERYNNVCIQTHTHTHTHKFGNLLISTYCKKIFQSHIPILHIVQHLRHTINMHFIF